MRRSAATSWRSSTPVSGATRRARRPWTRRTIRPSSAGASRTSSTVPAGVTAAGPYRDAAGKPPSPDRSEGCSRSGAGGDPGGPEGGPREGARSPRLRGGGRVRPHRRTPGEGPDAGCRRVLPALRHVRPQVPRSAGQDGQELSEIRDEEAGLEHFEKAALLGPRRCRRGRTGQGAPSGARGPVAGDLRASSTRRPVANDTGQGGRPRPGPCRAARQPDPPARGGARGRRGRGVRRGDAPGTARRRCSPTPSPTRPGGGRRVIVRFGGDEAGPRGDRQMVLHLHHAADVAGQVDRNLLGTRRRRPVP